MAAQITENRTPRAWRAMGLGLAVVALVTLAPLAAGAEQEGKAPDANGPSGGAVEAEAPTRVEKLEAEARARIEKLEAELRAAKQELSEKVEAEAAAAKARIDAAEAAIVKFFEDVKPDAPPAARGEGGRGERGERDRPPAIRPLITRPARESDRERPVPGRSGPGRSARDAAAAAQLARPLPEVKFDGVPLSDALAFFRETTGLNIHVKWKVLEQAEVSAATPVTLRLQDIPAGRALRLVLEEAGGPADVEMTIEEGTIIVSTAPDMARYAKLRTYDVSDLIAADPPQKQEGGQGEGEGPDAGGGGGRGLFSGQGRRPSEEKAHELVKLIEQSIAPGTWRDAGGTVGSAAVFGTKLVVTHTQSRHAEIESLLEDLRAGRGQ
jgi:hypothetical protein